MSWNFRITGFAGGRHPRAPFGTKLLVTSHKSEASAYAEIEAWRERMRRGEASKVELIDLRPGGNLTNVAVYQETQIPWSWRRCDPDIVTARVHP
jgi:hypothetical protein